jgi:hypothetical protein
LQRIIQNKSISLVSKEALGLQDRKKGIDCLFVWSLVFSLLRTVTDASSL